MPNTPESDLQVENETVEPYRGIMIFRTLQNGKVVGPHSTSTRVFPRQTYYATLDKNQAPKYDGSDILAYGDVEGVRALIDAAVPGQGLIAAAPDAAAAAKKAASGK